MMILRVKRMKNSASGNPNWQVMNGTDFEVRRHLTKLGYLKEGKNKVLGTYLKTKSNISFSYQIANNAILEVEGVKFRVEIV